MRDKTMPRGQNDHRTLDVYWYYLDQRYLNTRKETTVPGIQFKGKRYMCATFWFYIDSLLSCKKKKVLF